MGKRKVTYKEICSLAMLVIVGSFIGFVVENVWVSFRYSHMNNRGMYLPFLLGYGIACLLVYGLFGCPDKPRFANYTFNVEKNKSVVYFMCIFATVMAGEGSFGYAVERMTGMKWWSYNNIPLHIGRYTSVPTSIGFAACIYLFMNKVFPIIYRWGAKFHEVGCGAVLIVIVIALILDNIHALKYMQDNHETLKLWSIEFTKVASALS